MRIISQNFASKHVYFFITDSFTKLQRGKKEFTESEKVSFVLKRVMVLHKYSIFFSNETIVLLLSHSRLLSTLSNKNGTFFV